ncbi:MAG: bifunctional riboflavin kinase/FAD synthetase [Planctomycetota bacterium]
MKLFRKLDDLPDHLKGGAITIGNFDGVHRGHARLIDQLKSFASELDAAAIVFTFDPHPVRILRPEKAPPPLTWTNRKADLLAELGVDAVIAYPTTREMLELKYDDFFRKLVVERVGARAMVEGPNFFFGRKREGNVQRLAELCAARDIRLKIVQPLLDDEEFISSSRIRNLIRAGDVDLAREMLTRPYRIRGMVTHGAARGASIGFPTANLDAIDTLIPAAGVYAGRTYIDGRPHWSAIHIGPNPTFYEAVLKVESHVLDFDGSIYGSAVEVDFIGRLRDIRQFDSVEELTAQLEKDVAATRQVARNFPS